MSLRPLHDQVLIKRDRLSEEKTPGGIIIPDTARTPLTRGVIVALGSGKLLDNGELRPREVQLGDRVLFDKFAGDEDKAVDVDGETLLVLTEDNLLAVIDEL